MALKISGVKIHKFSSRKIIKRSKIANVLDKINKKLGHNLYDILPDDNYELVEFELHNTNSSFANAIRRCLISELPVWSLSLIESSLDTNDEYIRFDDLADRINTLPIFQTYFNKKKDIDVSFKLSYKNEMMNIKHVLSGDIKAKKIKEKLFEDNVSIQMLRPGCYMACNISLERGYGYQHGGKFVAVKNPIYRPIDITPMKKEYKKNPTGASSLISNPKKFYISYETYGTYSNPLEPLIMSLEELDRRVAGILKEVKKYKGEFYANENVKIMKEAGMYRFFLGMETITISKLFSRYIYDMNPNIEYVGDLMEHPSKKVVEVKVQDENAVKIFIKAGEKILYDIAKLKKSIK